MQNGKAEMTVEEALRLTITNLRHEVARLEGSRNKERDKHFRAREELQQIGELCEKTPYESTLVAVRRALQSSLEAEK